MIFMNPESILKLQKTLKIELQQLFEYEEFALWDNGQGYFLDKNKDVIGLNLQIKIADFSFLNDFPKLITLRLVSSNISNFSFLINCKQLENLSLKFNKISDFSFLKELPRLTNLNLNSNNITDISFLKDLTQLTSLYLGDNQILDFTHLNYLKKLNLLVLYKNNINDISFLKNLTQLKELYLSSNAIKDISVLKELKSLSSLDLTNNNIIDISPLKELIKSKIPIVLEQDGYHLNGICLDENPIQTPSFEIIKQGTDAIIRFFDKVEKEGIDKIYEAKVTLVGEGRAGKTSLIHRLLDSKSILPTEEKRTRGIAIKDWEFKKQSSIKHIAHIWDFGGQDVYYPVHRFFLTENSVFVLLASSRQNTHDFDYWIPTIFQFGGKSPIILGQTCHDGNYKHWNDIGVYLANENFNIIKDQALNYHEINLPKNNKGLLNIKKSIINQVLKLPHYKKNVPKSWIPVRELIDQLKKDNCISYLELKQKIQETNPESFITKDDVEDSVKFFHSIGILLWYHKEEKLKNWVILNPKWAVDAVYKIIDYKKQTNKGIILSKDFETVWNNKMYEDKHYILKEMLEVFKIAFPKKTNVADYIMPTRLDSIPTEKIWNEKESCLSIVYNFEFMPKGMVNQISAELSRYISSDEEVWNNAVNFKDDDTNSQVFENFYERKIIVKAKGNDSRSIIKLIMNAVDNITDGYKGVKNNVSIPCVCKECSKSHEPNMFPYQLLINKIRDNKELITCIFSDEVLKIESLLFNIGLPNSKNIKKNTKKEMESENVAPIYNVTVSGDFKGQIGGSNNSQKTHINNYSNNKDLSELKEILEQLKDSKQVNENWQKNFTEAFMEVCKLEDAKEDKIQIKSISNLQKFFFKAKEVKDWVAIGVLPAEIATKGDKMIELGKNLFDCVF